MPKVKIERVVWTAAWDAAGAALVVVTGISVPPGTRSVGSEGASRVMVALAASRVMVALAAPRAARARLRRRRVGEGIVAGWGLGRKYEIGK